MRRLSHGLEAELSQAGFDLQVVAVEVVVPWACEPRSIEIGHGCFVPPDLAVSLISAFLGFSAPAAVDLAGAVERRILCALSRAAREWIACAAAESVAATAVCVHTRCLKTEGPVALTVSWRELWNAVRRLAADAGPRITIKEVAAEVKMKALVRGPSLRLADLWSLAEGDLVLLPEGSGSQAVLAVNDRPVALGKLGVHGSRWALRVERFLEEGDTYG
jgi:hypothetical protein